MPAAGTEPRLCPIADALEVVGERWALLIVRELFRHQHRFAAIAHHTGAPRDVLSARLRSLVDAGVVERRRYSERPERFEYHLTPAGRDLGPVLASLIQWGERHRPGPGRGHGTHRGHELRPRVEVTCTTCGETLYG